MLLFAGEEIFLLSSQRQKQPLNHCHTEFNKTLKVTFFSADLQNFQSGNFSKNNSAAATRNI